MSRFFTLFLLFSTAAGAKAIPPLSGFTAAFTPTSTILECQTGMLNDTLPPQIHCPPGDTLSLASGQCDTAYQYVVTAFDSLQALTPELVSGLASGASFPLGNTLTVYEVADSAGNTASCSFSVLVIPATAGMACKTQFTVLLDNDCMVILAPIDVLMPPVVCLDSLSTYVVEIDKKTPFGNGPWLPPVLNATDHNRSYQVRVTNPGNNAKCFGMITVVDSLPPQLACANVQVPCALPTEHLTPIFLRDSLLISAGMPTVNENCPGNPTIYYVDVATDVPCDSSGQVSGYIRRFWTAIDAANNVSTCVQTINRVRELDAVQFPPDVTLSCDSADTLPSYTGGPFVEIDGRRYSLLDAPLCEISLEHTDSSAALCGGSYRIYRQWRVWDSCVPDTMRVPVTGVQLIDVLDQQAPVWTCPLDTVVSMSTFDCRGTLDLTDLLVTDGCSNLSGAVAYWTVDNNQDSLTASLEDFAGNVPGLADTLAVFGEIDNFPAGEHQILYVATDACGNTGTCAVTIRIWDGTPPQAVCDTLLKVFLDEDGQGELSALFPDNGSSDDCNDVFFKIRRTNAGICDAAGTQWEDQLYFCCLDAGDTVAVVLRVYDVALPNGPAPDTLAAGQYSECTVPVEILDINPPKCTAPANITVDCESFDPSLTSYGDIQTSCKVDSVALLPSYTFFDSVCTRGTITRTFRVFDTASGQSGQCTQRVTVSNQQHYFVRFPDDQVVTLCDTTELYGEPELFDVTCENMSVTFSDEKVLAVNDACFWIKRTWTVVNGCTFDPNLQITTVPNPAPNNVPNHPDNLAGPTVSASGTAAPWAPTLSNLAPNDATPTDFSLFWAPDVNGYHYTQIIKIIDTEAPVIENCPDAPLTYNDQSTNDILLWNANYSTTPGTTDLDLCEAAVDLSILATDACYGPDVQVNYQLFLDLNGDGIQESVVTSDNFPAPGSITFNNALTQDFNGGDPRLFDTRAVSASDKYQFGLETLAIGRRKLARVAWHTQNAPGAFLPLQLPLGSHRIKWIVTDGCGGETECEYNFGVEDPNNFCVPSEVLVKGHIKTPANAGVSDVAVSLEGTQPGVPAFNLFALTDDQGYYEFNLAVGDSYTITPIRDNDPLNGVSTLDLLLINKHVLGLEPLNTPYKLLAADANDSRTVTTFDIVELRKLILGIYPQLPANTSWRFIDAAYTFQNPANPFQDVIPESAAQANLPAGSTPVHDFIGIKVGDVNGNAIPNLQSATADDRSMLPMWLEDQVLKPGAQALVPVRIDAGTALQGLQFALAFDPALLEVEGLEPRRLMPTAAGGFDQFYAQPEPGVLTLSWDDLTHPLAPGAEPVFYLKIKSLQAVQLSQALALRPERLPAEGYLAGGAIQHLELRFAAAGPIAQTEIFPALPNPSAGQDVRIPLALAEPTTVFVEVYDSNGRQVYVAEEPLPAGFQQLLLPAEVLGQTPGIFAYRLRAGLLSSSGKLIRL
ncbi:MAG: HYR domain-containing protein [Saprospiraceae bacterium]|nr:HYR domain-containing protein [Saprospiraceae bacterium]